MIGDFVNEFILYAPRVVESHALPFSFIVRLLLNSDLKRFMIDLNSKMI